MCAYLSIDVGGTATKASLFDRHGELISTAERQGHVLAPRLGWVERDMEEVWATTVGAIRACTATFEVSAIDAISVVGHSDGVYPINPSGVPVSNAIQATDTRARAITRSFRRSDRGERLARITGTKPFSGSPAAICLWLLANDPSVLPKTRWLLSAKDWIRFRLTGQIATDPTDAGASFLDVRTLEYSDEALELYGLGEVRKMLPPIQASASVAGTVTIEAAATTGLNKGLKVVTGCHDVDAAAIGMDAERRGQLSIVAGTFSINQIITDRIIVDERWQVRPFVERGRWVAMSTSPTSATNLAWLADIVGGETESRYSELLSEVKSIDAEPSEISYLPYLFGAPDGEARASFMGVGNNHSRGHLTRAVLEGVILNHRLHLDWLAESYELPFEAHVTGGAARSDLWMQMFADGLALRLEVQDSNATSRGAAALAALAVGDVDSIEVAGQTMARPIQQYSPTIEGIAKFNRLYDRFLRHRVIAQTFATEVPNVGNQP